MTFSWELPLLVGGWSLGVLGVILLLAAMIFTLMVIDMDEWEELGKPLLLGYAVALVLIVGCLTCVGFYSGTYGSEQPQQTTTEQHNGPN
ncbi:hypothetical protein HOT82_gp027 [Gordonia phage Ronaldo]|uniref:Uncharacterized protein n=4 Tax=Ronaldovirus TaxID=2733205 RepID=A0A6B9LAE2_9CAUD|nr:hypothetical protein HOT81_gp024 [Gordonia phage Fryberger]YP_009807723.1 hypothetical protein HOT82_gp027 [Gordonia phage Ronaldo]QDH48366.1 hypothetical protein SEA_ZIKO_27 [Gordonia phage Ziko]QHB38143.1 hypothetical protein SEA_VOLT_26 [Gordonia phage Volt]AXN53442.1 hypothetical protein SEA_FRYBERGER_24 [Gordonia phage Fryberger]AXN53589.1 hypothetical protein SEA_RONALDO_27 [Gordonia phage Ronaldo]